MPDERGKLTPYTTCVCVAEHRPPVLEPQAHHLWPQFLGGPAHPGTLLALCPTTHANVHRALRAMLTAGRILTRAELQEDGRPAVPRYTWTTACNGFLAWDAAGRPDPR